MEFKETISRDYLRSERTRYLAKIRMEAVITHVQQHSHLILCAAREGKTQYVVGIPSQHGEHRLTLDDLLDGYRAKFPDCNVENGESWEASPRNPNQLNKKTGIIIDWS